ncbi:relaxase/mobilization nuclease domain-containing protein [Streptomyces sp. GXMU-J15]|uniref:Relaxase/mobilization nuclease domain-containing protein n=1 Tax=Streptomyces fuscus TaxID=3048495 RepID=A0ABT7IW75_9ACTN|nr:MULTISPECIES: relaxase/mobilization nuclease domain-containing protein [Streptomyces]MDL2075797.1 relaxase/mobilization nuclease domain-containing protein [Streptomyces fuscus]SBT93330.1 Relaxase/Mobilisation nuclease domain-containing protein [Streptomyces sp. DI166]
MIPSVNDMGDKTLGLLMYLYGPGDAEEHIDPHLVAAWDSLAPDPGRDPDATEADLQFLLDQPVTALPEDERPALHVWHLSVRAAPEDPILTDEQWGDIARRMVSATGIAPDGDDAACRWAAVRHADDHIHIIATVVRHDGRQARIHRDGARAQAEARQIEIDYGLRRVNVGDGTAAKRPSSAERHKANRQGKERTPREELRETVRRAAAGVANEKEFFDRLTAAGLLVHQRVAPSGDLLGYKVALSDDRNEDQEPIYYSGSTLAPDLSLPRIRERWAGNAAEPDQDTTTDRSSGSDRVRPSDARRQATAASWQAVLIIDQGEDGQVSALIAAGGEVLDALAKTSAAHTRRELRDAAFVFERATRSHVRAEREHARGLRNAARKLVQGGPALGRVEDGATTAMLIDMVFFLVTAAAHWHAMKGHAQQAAAARQAAEHLRDAYQAAAPMYLGVMRDRGRRMSLPLRRKQTGYLRQAVPELAEQVLAEPGWYALASTLADVERAGHDPAALLAEAAARRELGTAESISDVLVWRLRRMADLPADASTLPEHNTTAPTTTRPAAKRPARRKERPTNYR